MPGSEKYFNDKYVAAADRPAIEAYRQAEYDMTNAYMAGYEHAARQVEIMQKVAGANFATMWLRCMSLYKHTDVVNKNTLLEKVEVDKREDKCTKVAEDVAQNYYRQALSHIIPPNDQVQERSITGAFKRGQRSSIINLHSDLCKPLGGNRIAFDPGERIKFFAAQAFAKKDNKAEDVVLSV